ncbi:Hypothetical predicted protein [Paramuricea clavata]|uniref:Uncharacterized protein n=1 Tax=Paramuricea clavata TaxID=317549 RepID=A0A6S7LNG8_PARCT|nr:Hypothetical predicted protein [Paramuricea clavata]
MNSQNVIKAASQQKNKEEQRKRNDILFSSQVAQKKEAEVTERILHLNGEPVCVNGNQSVISRHEDPVPDYTISLGDIPLADLTSDVTNCEAVYTGRIQGLKHLWKEKFNRTHLHFADRAHKIESMIGKIRKEAGMRWLDKILISTGQEQAAEGDNEICGHLKNLVRMLFLSTLLILADIFSQSAFTSEATQSDLYPLWDDKANVDKFIGNITKMA